MLVRKRYDLEKWSERCNIASSEEEGGNESKNVCGL